MPIPLKTVTSSIDLIQAKTDLSFKTKITFEPHCRLEYEIFFSSGDKQIGLIAYCLPVAPGKSRIVAQFSRNVAQKIQAVTLCW